MIIADDARTAAVKAAVEALATTQSELVAEAFGVPSDAVATHRAYIAMATVSAAIPVIEKAPHFPPIVVLCGSTRFRDEFEEVNRRYTMQGVIVLSVGAFVHSTKVSTDKKRELDWLHKRKIDLADRVVVLNIDGYVGESTRSEVEYATSIGKPVDYWEAVP